MMLQSIPYACVVDTYLTHQVSEAAALDADSVHNNTLRWWDGKHRPAGPVLYGGVLIAPHGVDCNDISDIVVRTSDPKRAFIHCMRRLYPHPVKVQVKTGIAVEVHPTAVVGKEGFGFHDEERVPHIGHVELHSRVSLGAHTCVDRGTLGNTVIGSGTKVDNLVHIAHNVRIGSRCQVVAGAVIGGSAIIGDDVFIGINASIRNGVRIGNGAVVGMGAVVTKDVPERAVVAGNPARVVRFLDPAHAL